MVLNKPESSDTTAKNALVIPAGSYAFIKVALREGKAGPLVPLDPDWESVGSSIVTITDPDGAPLVYNTNALDPSDVDDDYDDGRASYVGDSVTPEIVGLHATLSGGIPVRFALKVLVPSGAEQTSNNSGRSYTVTWNLKKNGNVVVATETFNVGPSGVPVFSDVTVTSAEVLCGIFTELDSVAVDCLLEEAAAYVRMELLLCGIPSDTTDEATLVAVKQASLIYARHLISFYDASAGKQFEMIQEGAEKIKLANIGTGANGTKGLYDRAKRILDAICKNRNANAIPSMGIVNRFPTSSNNRGGCC